MALEHERDEEEDAKREDWSEKAKKEDTRCEICGELIEYDDVEGRGSETRCSAHADT